MTKDDEAFAYFLNLVADLRQAQKAFFRSRSPEDLDAARDRERQVDAYIKSAKDPQAKLF